MMSVKPSFILRGLLSRCDLHSAKTTPLIEEQLRQQSSRASDSYRYEVTFEIIEGRGCPALDLDNYTKPMLDAITRTQLVWRDDRQIDVQIVRRKRDRSRESSEVAVAVRRLEGQHGGVPSYFRARCHEAKTGVSSSYQEAGYHFAMHLWSEQPYDIEDNDWAARVAELVELIDIENTEGVWYWFCRHFPACMRLVPKRRLDQFVRGVLRAYEDGRLEN